MSITLLSTALLALVAGAFIGAIGIGGILLVSGLIYIGGHPPAIAIAVCMFGYLLTGAIGTWAYARAGSIRWSSAVWLGAGAVPLAFAGAWTTNTVSPIILELAVGVLTAGAGINALLTRTTSGRGDGVLSRQSLVLIGAFTGFGSAMTGTGGPLLLVPILLWLEVPILTAIGLSQVIQVPIAILATLGNALYGAIDWQLGVIVAGALAVGSWAGAKVAHAVPKELLRRAVAVSLLVIGSAIVLKIVARLLAGSAS